MSMCIFKLLSVRQCICLKQCVLPSLSGSQSDSHHEKLNTVLFTCELSWRALKAAGFAGSGLVSWAPSPLMPLFPLPPALAAVAGRTAAGPQPAQLLLGHQETWQTLWGEKSKTTFITKYTKYASHVWKDHTNTQLENNYYSCVHGTATLSI